MRKTEHDTPDTRPAWQQSVRLVGGKKPGLVLVCHLSVTHTCGIVLGLASGTDARLAPSAKIECRLVA